MRTIFNPFASYQILDLVEEEIQVIIAEVMAKKPNGSTNEDIQQSIETRTPNEA